ncbi:MAG: methyltransferase domain-containing protein [Actinomycetota bacterium]
MIEEPQVPDDYGPATYGDAFADVYDDWYADVSDVGATVAAITALAGYGVVLELGVGTGRLALPLAARGISVVGVDASQAMLDLLAAKPGAETVTAVLADMGDLDASTAIAGGGPYRAAFAAFNTFFNLTSDAAQAACLRSLFALVEPGGSVVIEGFVPPTDGLAEGGVSVRDVSAEGAVITVSKHDAEAQVIRGHHVEITASGNRLRPWLLHYRTPAQLDIAAEAAGFELSERWSDWTGTPFPTSSDDEPPEVHVSVYRRP